MPFKRGQSGNPNGRPPGRGARQQAREAIARRLPELIDSLVQQALAGDATAAKVLIDKIVPTAKPEAAPASIRFAKGTLSERAETIVQAIGEGRVAPDTGAQLLAALGRVASIIEVTELEQRIAALEGAP